MKRKLILISGFVLIVITSVAVLNSGEKSNDAPAINNSNNTFAYFPETNIDMGILETGKSVRIMIPFENRGENGLRIQNIISECGCSVPEWPLRPIPPGAKENIHINFTPVGSGHFNKVLSIFANNSEGPIVIHITGNAKPDIQRVINSIIDSGNFKN
jgi:hypothetical protein